MLAALPAETRSHRVFRLANRQFTIDFLWQQGFETEDIEEVSALLQSAGIRDSLQALCDEPFRPTARLRKRARTTRFSDGSFPVFYCSLEAATAEAEIRYWIPRFIDQSDGPRTVWYSGFACDFNGTVKDLRRKQADWPALTHDDYGFCNRLGKEAVAEELDGLLAPSARRAGGTNLPVFRRRTIDNPGDLTTVAATYDPETGDITLASVL